MTSPAAVPQSGVSRPVRGDGRLIVHELTSEGDVLRARLSVNGRKREVIYKLGGIEPTQRVDALAVALLPLAMSKGWTLELPGELSPGLGRGLDSAQALLAGWWKHWTRVELKTGGPPSESPVARDRGVACFLTGGVDSFYSVLTELDRLDAVIFVHGFDVPLGDAPKREQVAESLREAADGLGLELIEVESNLRDLAWQGCKWGRHAHGAALASVALLAGDRFSEVLISASHTPEDLHPWGSHEHLDHLWSTQAVRVAHHGQAGRTRKVARLAESDVAMDHLRCCFEKTRPGETNCGHCEKCLRTMASLRIVGALERCATMPDRLPLGELARMPLERRGWVVLTRDLHSEAKAVGDQELAWALRRALLLGRWRARATNARKAVESRSTKARRKAGRRIRRGFRRAKSLSARRAQAPRPGNEPRVRPAVLPDDRKAIMKLLEPEGLHPIPSREMDDLSVGTWLVYESAGVVVGVAGFRLDRTSDGFVGKNLLLAVEGEHRGQGVGRALVNRRLELMRQAGVGRVITNTDRPELISWLIRDYGYRKVGEVEKLHPFGRPDVDRWTTLEASVGDAVAGMYRSSQRQAD
jgi:GNAT superfamily N-acetyltransferase